MNAELLKEFRSVWMVLALVALTSMCHVCDDDVHVQQGGALEYHGPVVLAETVEVPR